MKCLFIILNDYEKLDELLVALANAGIKGATILESTGMAQQLLGDEACEVNFIGSLRNILNPDRKRNYTIFSVLTEQQVNNAKEAVTSVLGDLSKPNAGIIFTVPVDFIAGGAFNEGSI